MLKGKTALITGANGGIGKSVLDLFLKNDANVICLIRKQDKKFEKYVKKFSKKVNIIETDLTDEKNLKIKLEKIFSKKKKIRFIDQQRRNCIWINYRNDLSKKFKTSI